MNVKEPVANVNVLIVDDEEFACLNLRKTLTEYIDAGIDVVAIACSTAEAEEKIGRHKPDIVFFDIEMPNENAFNFLERAETIDYEIIFVTAYDEYAVRAFKLNAVDYILKPISVDEVAEAVKKAKQRLMYRRMDHAKPPGNSYRELAAAIKPGKMRLKVNNGYEIVEFNDIISLEAKGSYTLISFYSTHNNEQHLLLSNTLNEYEELLPADLFLRVHRSYIINYAHLRKILHTDNCYALMKNDAKIPVSRRRAPALMSVLKNNCHE